MNTTVIFCLTLTILLTAHCSFGSDSNSCHDERDNPAWSQCLNRWRYLIKPIASDCHIPQHKVDEIIMLIESQPEKSWRLYELLRQCSYSDTQSHEIMQHVELCLDELKLDKQCE